MQAHSNIGILSVLCKKYLRMIENKCFQVFYDVFFFLYEFTYIGRLYFLLYYFSDKPFFFFISPKKGSWQC